MTPKAIDIGVCTALVDVMQLAQVALAKHARISLGDLHVLIESQSIVGVMFVGATARAHVAELLADPVPRATRLVFTDEPLLPEDADAPISVEEVLLRALVARDEKLHTTTVAPICGE